MLVEFLFCTALTFRAALQKASQIELKHVAVS
jgi:hypothetical protein